MKCPTCGGRGGWYSGDNDQFVGCIQCSGSGTLDVPPDAGLLSPYKELKKSFVRVVGSGAGCNPQNIPKYDPDAPAGTPATLPKSAWIPWVEPEVKGYTNYPPPDRARRRELMGVLGGLTTPALEQAVMAGRDYDRTKLEEFEAIAKIVKPAFGPRPWSELWGADFAPAPELKAPPLCQSTEPPTSVVLPNPYVGPPTAEQRKAMREYATELTEYYQGRGFNTVFTGPPEPDPEAKWENDGGPPARELDGTATVTLEEPVSVKRGERLNIRLPKPSHRPEKADPCPDAIWEKSVTPPSLTPEQAKLFEEKHGRPKPLRRLGVKLVGVDQATEKVEGLVERIVNEGDAPPESFPVPILPEYEAALFAEMKKGFSFSQAAVNVTLGLKTAPDGSSGGPILVATCPEKLVSEAGKLILSEARRQFGLLHNPQDEPEADAPVVVDGSRE